MLCYPFEEKRLKRWNTPAVFTQRKLDGDRCRVLIFPDNTVKLLSSEVHEIVSVPHIEWEIQQLYLPPCELDGELYTHGLAHDEIRSIVGRTVEIHPNFETMQFHMFDIMTDSPQIKRVKEASDFYDTYLKHTTSIQFVPTDLIPATAVSVINQMGIYSGEGYEGIIVRSPFGHYERRRSVDIMKFKPKKKDAYEVVGYEQEIDKNGNPKESLGALILQSDAGQVFNVGSGSFLTRAKREELWEKRETLKGMTAVIAYQGITFARKVPYFQVLIDLLSIQKQETKSASGVEPTTP